MLNRKIEYNPSYQGFLSDQRRYNLLYGGAGSGKSVAAAQKILMRCLEEPGHRFLCIRRIYKTCRGSTFQLLVDLLSEWGVNAHIRRAEMHITLPNGSEIIHGGLANAEDREKLKSIAGVTGIWIEEATEIKELDFEQIDLRLRGKTPSYKQVILTFNPISQRSWLKLYFFDTDTVPDDDKLILRTTHIDNYLLDTDYRRKLHRTRSEEYKKVYLLGEWGGQLKGQIITDYVVTPTVPEGLPTVYGVDFGFNNPAAIVQCWKGDAEYYVKEWLYQTDLTTRDLIREFKEFYVEGIRAYCDSASPDKIKEMYRAGINAHKSNKDVNAGISTIQSYPLCVVKGSHNIMSEIQSYAWDQDKEGNPVDKPLKKDDHAMDAIRYAIHSAWGIEPTGTRFVL